MKNKLILAFLLFLFYFQNISCSEPFVFEVKNIEILENGNKINAFNGKAFSKNNNFQISSDKFIYIKNIDFLESIGNGNALLSSKKIKISYDHAIFDQLNNFIKASGNVKLSKIDNTLEINNDEINYDYKNNILNSDSITEIKDIFGNIYYVDSFVFEINKDLIKVKNLISKDINLNTYKSKIAFINLKTGNVFGKDVEINLENQFVQIENDFRFKGNSFKIDKNSTQITKGVFTTCKKRDSCPPWQFMAKSITHDKKKQEIIYEKAFLKIYDKPFIYFPKFFHPDPTVKRKSGFLIPSFKSSSNSNNYLNIPYYHVLAENKDITIKPRLFFDEKILLQSEYRQKNFKSSHELDLSVFSEKNKSSKNHLFYKYIKDFNFNKFDSSKINLNIQKTSNDNYLKMNNIKSDLMNDANLMENNFELELYSDDLLIDFSSAVYENLNKINNDRYEYIFPRLKIEKNFSDYNNSGDSFTLNSESLVRQYNTNVLEKVNINNLIYNSNPIINDNGFVYNHELIFRNTNTDNKNTNYKNKKNIYLSGIYQFNSNIPLIKEDDNYQKILKPRFSLKLAPGHTKDNRNSEKKIDLTNLYSIDRATDESSIEGGMSATYGFDYVVTNKNKKMEIFNIKIANNLRAEENEDLTKMNQIGQKISNVFSEITFSPNEIINTKYISAIKNNLNDISYENLITNIKLGNFLTTFDYLNENNTSIKNSYLSNKTSYSMNNSNSFEFSTRKNKTKDLTEYYNLMYQYKNDCLAASIEYNKEFYNDKDYKPEENILFKLTITPFTELDGLNIAPK